MNFEGDDLRQIKKYSNAEKSKEILEKEGIQFTEFTKWHLRVTTDKGDIDFWPSTGKYITRYTKDKSDSITGRGVFNLLKEVRGDG